MTQLPLHSGLGRAHRVARVCHRQPRRGLRCGTFNSPFSWFVPSRSAAALGHSKALTLAEARRHSDFAVELETEMPYRRLYVRARDCVLRITKDC